MMLSCSVTLTALNRQAHILHERASAVSFWRRKYWVFVQSVVIYGVSSVLPVSVSVRDIGHQLRFGYMRALTCLE